MLSDDEAFVRAMRRVAENHDGPSDIRMPRNVLLRMVELAEAGLPIPDPREES